MKPTSTLLLVLLLLMLIPNLANAQEKKDYSVLLHSGKFVPTENIAGLAKNAEVFQRSLFADRYYIAIQFRSLPTQAEKDQLKAIGIELIDYLPNYTYTASVAASIELNKLSSFPVRSIFSLNAVQKTVPALLEGRYPVHALKQPGFVDVTVITYEKMNAASIRAELAKIDASILEDMPMYRSFTLRIAQSKIKELPALAFIQWVEFIDPPNVSENLLGRSLHRVNVLNDGVRNLKGDGINIGIWDEGEISPHLDFSPAGRLTQMEFSTASSHSTHCSGTLAGRGLIDPRARGMAPNAKLYSWNFNGNIQTEMFSAIPAQGLHVSSHSYGSTLTCGLNGAGVTYSSTSRATDINLNTYPNHLHVHSAGNSQTGCPGGWSTITASGKSSKNNILVANISSTEVINSTSSFGPVQDGRVKPEISSFGTGVLSTYTPLNAYGTISGTSMATPGVAGSVSLLVQRYQQLNGGVAPPSSLIKNTICNTAFDLGTVGPDYKFGYGRINALQAVRILEQNRYAINNVTTGGTNDFTIAVPAGAARLRVMLTWNDPAGAANANPAIVNNLDLSVINGSTTTLPWILDPNVPANPATQAVDNVSNIEQVTIDNPAAGNYTVRVNGTMVPTGPNQEYYVTWSIEQPYIEVTYPNGGESFNPGVAETITWDNAGLTAAQTVQYSLDNGNNWTVIASGLSAATTRVQWSAPVGANTSTALIRVQSGTVSDVSDATFKILGTPTGLSINAASCIPGEVNFTWTATPNATHYDLLRLDMTTGAFIVLASNITTNSHTATGLTPNSNMWVTLVAKNNTTGATSEKAMAINITVPSGGLSPIGAISGSTSICGLISGVTYTVPAVAGATNYSWTVPAGASIATGQGTNQITVNFTATPGGNITVFASAGACQTATASLGVTVSNAVNAPVSGGNQTQATCPPAPIPTLTATATVPAGHSIVWYDAATAGNVVASPTLNFAGTVTYFAAAVNNTSGCESTTRTPVTLTLTAPPPASISANGPIVFCQGGSVTLTANTGTSYLWSTGATTQSIVVSTSGSYTVLVNQGSGCAGTSPAVVVTVNALPTVTVTPSGQLVFCEGNNVVLTSTAASSYLWTNGATTQSITVTTSGSYAVTVRNAANCSTVSSTFMVAVSPKPTVSISAAPYTRLFPGLTTTISSTITPSGNYTYAWTRNGAAITAPATFPVTIDNLGAYAVTVTNAAGCFNTSNTLTISDSTSGRLFLYPNPSNGQFQLSHHYTGASTVTIFDSKGSQVWSQAFVLNIPYERMNMDIRKHGRGTYHVVLSDRNGKKLASGGVVIQ